VIEIRLLTEGELERVDRALPLHRLRDSLDETTYLIAWEGDSPLGHAYLAWERTELGLPELQDVFVAPERRGEGIGTALTQAAEVLAAERGHSGLSLSVGVGNPRARAFYERLGYEPAEHPPKHMQGTIMIRGTPLEVDETLLYYVKPVGAQPEHAR
jgi:GNAT superfamily N-acetyltransferase